MSAPAAKARVPRDHDRADCVIGVELHERRAERVHQSVVESVEDLGPIEGDDADAALRSTMRIGSSKALTPFDASTLSNRGASPPGSWAA